MSAEERAANMVITLVLVLVAIGVGQGLGALVRAWWKR